jgi:hypothetical protein
MGWKEITLALIGGGIIGGLIQLVQIYLARRKTRAEARKTEAESGLIEIENVKAAVEVKKTLVSSLDEFTDMITDAMREKTELLKRATDCEHKNMELERMVDVLRSNTVSLSKEIRNIRESTMARLDEIEGKLEKHEP